MHAWDVAYSVAKIMILTPTCVCLWFIPDVAEMVLNKCTTTNAKDVKNIRPDSEQYCVTFDYCFLEDRERALK